jgi:hypothetical protein
MLKEYRDWLESELKLLGNASHHAYSFGQANMAKRAIERLDALLAMQVVILLGDSKARSLLTAIEMLEQTTTTLDPAFDDLRKTLQIALEEQARQSG